MLQTTSWHKDARTMSDAAGSKLINAVSHSVSQANARDHARIEKQRRLVEKNKRGDLHGWLKRAELEAGMAKPVMHAIGQAEKICGRRLCVSLSHGVVLSSRGFRLVAPKDPDQIGFFVAPGANVERVSARRIRRRLDVTYSQAEVLQSIKKKLDSPDLTQSLLYMGVDEWPLHRKVLWGAMTGATLSMGVILSFPHFFIHRRDYEQALRPALSS